MDKKKRQSALSEVLMQEIPEISIPNETEHKWFGLKYFIGDAKVNDFTSLGIAEQALLLQKLTKNEDVKYNFKQLINLFYEMARMGTFKSNKEEKAVSSFLLAVFTAALKDSERPQ